MANFIKITLFLLVIIGAGIWFIANEPTLFRSGPAEKVSVSAKPLANYTAPANVPAPAYSQPVSQQQEIPDSSIPAGYTRAQLSPYFQKIRISSAYSSSYSGYPAQIQLYSNLSKGEKVNITGWKIRSNRNEIIIPDAVELFDLSGFLSNSNIAVVSNSYVSIYSNLSAVNRNLRLNKCMGYLENDYEFIPQLPRSCPQVSRSGTQYLSGPCQSYIFSLGGCGVPDVSFYNSLPGNDSGNACREFLSNINYNSCIKEHRSDADFYSNDWRVWVGKNILDTQHDTVSLFDTQGLLVSQYVY